jgi:hypothetical protein
MASVLLLLPPPLLLLSGISLTGMLELFLPPNSVFASGYTVSSGVRGEVTDR